MKTKNKPFSLYELDLERLAKIMYYHNMNASQMLRIWIRKEYEKLISEHKIKE